MLRLLQNLNPADLVVAVFLTLLTILVMLAGFSIIASLCASDGLIPDKT